VSEHWLAFERKQVELGEHSFKTLGQYAQLSRDYIVPIVGDLRLDKVQLTDLEAVLETVGMTISKKTGRRLSKQTVFHVFSSMRRCLYYAHEYDMTTMDVPKLMKRLGEQVTVNKYVPKRLTKTQLLAFHAMAKHCKYGRVFTVALSVLGREAEVLGLRAKNIDDANGVVHIVEELQFLPPELRPKRDKKGDQRHAGREANNSDDNGAVIVEHVKTDTSEAESTLEVGPKFLAAVRAMRKDQLKRRSACIARGEPWHDTLRVMVEGRLSDLREEPNDLLVTTDNGLPLSPKVLRDHFVAICTAARIPYSTSTRKGLRIQDLRGSAAVLLLTDQQEPTSPSEVMRRGRWKSWSMLMYYTEIWERAQSVIAKKADRLGFG
jgi:integrase